jgi:hypothetical protein
MLTPDALREWHDFFVMTGGAAAALIGAMFIVASISSGYNPETRIFVTPSVVHLSTILVASAVGVVPGLDGRAFGIIFGAGAVIGLVYSGVIWSQVRRRKLGWDDRLWYAPVPGLGYVAALGASAMMERDMVAGPLLLAAGLILLLIAGIRNAWDLILYLVAQNRKPD